MSGDQQPERIDANDTQILAIAIREGISEAVQEASGKARRGFHFDGTLNLGHVLTAVTLAAGLALAYAAQTGTDTDQNSRLDSHDQQIRTNSSEITSLQQNYSDMRATLSRIDERTTNMNESVNRVERKLEGD